VGWLDSAFYRHPFEGGSARRYEHRERPAFGGLDDRILDGMSGVLARAQRLLDLGCGPQTFSARAAARHPSVTVIAVDPSRDFARPGVLRARGEELPLATGAIDAAICLSSIRHVSDRAATLRELRRVVAPGGTLVIVELDPAADARRIAAHADRLGGWILRRAFGPLVVRTAPRAEEIERVARDAGWQLRARRDDPEQPVYVMDLA
jgi:ubiquinone/menaquinone biosynthesis C-methylase UbiE